MLIHLLHHHNVSISHSRITSTPHTIITFTSSEPSPSQIEWLGVFTDEQTIRWSTDGDTESMVWTRKAPTADGRGSGPAAPQWSTDPDGPGTKGFPRFADFAPSWFQAGPGSDVPIDVNVLLECSNLAARMSVNVVLGGGRAARIEVRDEVCGAIIRIGLSVS